MKIEAASVEAIKLKIAKMSIAELYEISNFDVSQDRDYIEEGYTGSGKWYLYQSICQLGGCSYDGIPFNTEREALENAALMSLQGKNASTHPCPECYREYLNDCM